MAKLLYNIEEVFTSYLKNKQYNIPEYQRGYKWSNQQIEQLLKDINDFNGSEDLFYCLQNITLVLQKDKHLINVVDGQQRLTTLILLLAYLEQNELIKDKLKYCVRASSNSFLQEVIVNKNNIQETILNNNFDEFIKSHVDFNSQDIYYMYSAYNTFNTWFKDKDKQKFSKKLLKQVKLIVNQVDINNEQELFMNLNSGQVHLDGSDLVRAILITRVAKEEIEGYDANNIKNIVRINERRVRIGWELDEINSWWSKPSVKKYFSKFTKVKTGETVKFNVDTYPINLLYFLWFEIRQSNKSVILLKHFEPNEEQTALSLYKSIIHLHRTLKDWFKDRDIYHLLGFLFHQTENKFSTIWKEWIHDDATRSGFIKSLKEKIESNIFGVKEKDNNQNGLDFWLEKVKYDKSKPFNWYSEKNKLQKILLLLDIIEHTKDQEEKGTSLPFLKPKYFKKIKEDIEHIYPGTPRELSVDKQNSIKKIFEKINSYIKKLNSDWAETLSEWVYSDKEWEDLENEEQKLNTKLDSLKSKIHEKLPINSIGNLVLLDLSLNRSIGNKYYKDKRKAIVKHFVDGKHIRYHTYKVFLKQDTTENSENDNLNEWTMTNIVNNADTIYTTISSFFNIKKQ